MSEPTRLVGMREFREQFHRLREPVKVIRTRGGMEVIGVFIPEPRKPGKAQRDEPND